MIIAALTSGTGDENTVIGAFARSIKPQDKTIWYAPSLYTAQSHRPANLAVFDSQKGQAKVAAELFKNEGTPVIILDLGYLNRPERSNNYQGYWQVSLNKLGWLPPFECPQDRLKALNVQVTTRGKTPDGAKALILLQVPGDAQHGMSEAESIAWVKGVMSELDNTGVPYIVRSHPKAPFAVPGVYQQDPSEVSLAEAVAQASFVVTYNSTAAVEAIKQGVPVFCNSTAHYAVVANYGTYAAPETASEADRVKYLSRLAYAQWTFEEISNGDAWNFMQMVLSNKSIDPYGIVGAELALKASPTDVELASTSVEVAIAADTVEEVGTVMTVETNEIQHTLTPSEPTPPVIKNKRGGRPKKSTS